MLILLVLSTLGCATAQKVDPFESFNRKVHAFNDGLDRTILRPVAQGYDRVTPDRVQTGIGNFFENLGYPTVVINQFLQGQLRTGLADTLRFAMNSTFGLLGVFDVAARVGLESHDEDFGQTLAVWGSGPGAYIVVPLWGPVTARDGFGDILGTFTHPLFYVDNPAIWVPLRAIEAIDSRAGLLETERLISGDKYLFIRDAYLQRRNYLIHNGEPGEDLFLDEDFE